MRVALLALALALPAASQDPVPNPIDRYFDAYWERNHITSGPPADDYEFLRRASLDVLGRLPKPDEIRAFEKSKDRSKKIDELLENPEAAEFFADTWLRILMNYHFDETAPLRVSFPAFSGYLKGAYAKDLPYRDFATQLLSDVGDYKQHPASNFILAALDPNQAEPPHELTSRTTRIFLGIQIQCARCHDHPFDKYTQEDFWGLTAFFEGVKPKARQTFDGFGVKLMSEPKSMMMAIPDTKTEVGAHFLDGRTPEDPKAPLKSYAKYVVDHPLFPRAIVNRLWAHFMGRGFVEPIDKFSERTPPNHPELLDALCREFERGGTRLRPFMRTILTSKAYQAPCDAGRDHDPSTHARMILKPQSPVQVLNLLTWTLHLDVFFQQFYKQFVDNKQLPETYRNPEVFRMYLHQFTSGLLAPTGTAPETAKYTGSVRLALKLMNSHDLQGLVRAEWGRLATILKERESSEDRLAEIFYTLLSRPPHADEKARYLDYLKRKHEDKKAFEDIYWVLLNSTELYFNH
jgi:hypothetical protein